MTRLRDVRSILAFALVLAVAVATAPAFAGSDAAKPAPVGAEKTDAAEPVICTDDTPTAAERAAREAKLADLGRRLQQEAAVQRDIQVLNRTGLNYSDRRTPPPLPAPVQTP